MAELKTLKSKLEKALNIEKDPLKWTNDVYDLISQLLDQALENDLGDPRDRLGIGATTLVQTAQNACIRYERQQIKTLLAQEPSADVVRICNGKKVIGEECLRILNSLNALSLQTWNEAVLCPELNGPILANPRMDILARDMRSRMIKIRMAHRRIDSLSRLEEALRMTTEATKEYENLENKVAMEINARIHAEADARNNVDHIGQEQQTKSTGESSIPKSLLGRQSTLESLDLQHILASQMEQTMANNAAIVHPTSLDEKKGKDSESFAKALFTEEDSEITKPSTPIITESNPAADTVNTKKESKLRAKREERERDRRNKLKKTINEEDDSKAIEAIKVRTVKDKMIHGRRTKNYKMKNEADKKRLDQVFKARAEVEEGDDDTEEEKIHRAEARKFLIKYDGNIWLATKTGKLDIVKKYFLVESPERLLTLHNKDVNEGRRTLLHTACWWGHANIAQYLIQLGADIDAIDTIQSKTTPLIEAARAGRSDIVKLLLDERACVSHQDSHGDTPLHWAARRGWNSLVIYMAQHAQQQTPGIAPKLFSIENYHGYMCMEVGRTAYLSDVIRKEFAFVITATREQRRATRLHGLNRMRRSSMRLVPTALLPPTYMHEAAFENVVDVKAEVLHDLAQLGINLGAYSYSRG
ncbi:hypothetical protein THRCLA_07532 [Thraustotheca clavata]|uniref:Uncharacterized protein n=1 Tax=Thraustotheca clavata TaxID=74557 RepID=A0A1V9ZCW0_9STRA|nr:hypothetical protein THRCLA_07532 [Thraustotheca clavata]